MSDNESVCTLEVIFSGETGDVVSTLVASSGTALVVKRFLRASGEEFVGRMTRSVHGFRLTIAGLPIELKASWMFDDVMGTFGDTPTWHDEEFCLAMMALIPELGG